MEAARIMGRLSRTEIARREEFLRECGWTRTTDGRWENPDATDRPVVRDEAFAFECSLIEAERGGR